MSDANGDEPGQWRTFGERTVYEDAYVRLGQADVEVPGGERIWHDVIRLHRGAFIVLLDDGDQVLMLWRHRFVPDRWGWELPGGLVDSDEELSDAAARELEEQTGYRAGDVRGTASRACVIHVPTRPIMSQSRDLGSRIGHPSLEGSQ